MTVEQIDAIENFKAAYLVMRDAETNLSRARAGVSGEWKRLGNVGLISCSHVVEDYTGKEIVYDVPSGGRIVVSYSYCYYGPSSITYQESEQEVK